MTEEKFDLDAYVKEVEELEKNYKPKNTASPCYEFFLDYMKCQRHVSAVIQQSQSLFKLPESKEKIKFSKFCMDPLDRYEYCTHQHNTHLEDPNLRLLKHSMQDLEEYQRSLSIEERFATVVGMSMKLRDDLDPNWKERLDKEPNWMDQLNKEST